MMSKSVFYTNVQRYGNTILHRGYRNGVRFSERVEYQPTMFVSTKSSSEWTTIFDEPVEPVKPGTMRDCRDFIDRYAEVSNFMIYGNTNYHIQAIHEWYPDVAEYSADLIRTLFFDIETHDTTGGYVFSDDHKVLVRKKMP